MKKIVFLHGFFSSGSCPQAEALRDALSGKAEVLSPDLPMRPYDALEAVRRICDNEKPDLLVGNSCGAFYAQIAAPLSGIPSLLGNPHFRMTEFLTIRKGDHQYKFPRKDGKQDFTIDDSLIEEFGRLEKEQFDFCNDRFADKVWGLFGEKDTLAGFRELFLEHYKEAFTFPGNHTPTPEEVKKYYAPLALEMMEKFPVPEERFFRHFKGMEYRYLCSAHDSETLERTVIYKALYGEGLVWARPEKMFFGSVERDGKVFRRFTEISREELSPEAASRL